jgi:hypothetical protein
MRAPRRVLGAAILALEALVVALTGLVAKDLGDTSPGLALTVCGVLAVLCLVVAGMLRSRAGYVLGWIMQAAVVATGLLVPVMLGLGLVFALLWWTALYQGARIERERAWYAARRDAPGAADAHHGPERPGPEPSP